MNPTAKLSAIEEARVVAHRSRATPAESAGAIVVTRDGTRFPGVAVQLTAATGLSVCAEQVALSAARAASSEPIEEIALWIPAAAGQHPCGKCLQVWLELAPKARFRLQRGETAPSELSLRELLPDAFTTFEPNPEP